MAILGKGVKSIRKKDLQGQKELSVYKRIRFAHKASGGETGIDLTSLTTPVLEMPGFVQATAAEISSARMLFNQKNLTLVSSARGVLTPYMSYTVASNTRINFTDGFGTALPNEVFLGIVESTDRVGGAIAEIDAVSFAYVLPAGQTDVPLGKPVPVNSNPNEQIGPLLVFIDGAGLQLRNVGNATASPSANGNYELVDNGGGLATILRFNQADPINSRLVTVVSNGFMAVRPTDSVMAEIESNASQIDAVVPYLSALAGVPESTFQAQPNSQDLKAFALRFAALEDVALPAASASENGGHVTNIDQTFGGRKSAGNSKVHAEKGAAQPITTDAMTEIIFATEIVDTNGEYNPLNGRFMPNRAGYYMFNASIYATFTSGVTRIRIWKNNPSTLLAAVRQAFNSNGAEVNLTAGPVFLNGTTDYVSVTIERPVGIATQIEGESRFFAYEVI